MAVVRNYTYFFLSQARNSAELERERYAMTLESERGNHMETVAKFNLDKKNILISTEEANMEAMGEMQRNMEQEQKLRKVTEERMFAMEKEKSGISVDLQQLRHQISSLQTELRNENDKVLLYELLYEQKKGKNMCNFNCDKPIPWNTNINLYLGIPTVTLVVKAQRFTVLLNKESRYNFAFSLRIKLQDINIFELFECTYDSKMMSL